MIKRLVPKDFRPLLEYISPAAFKVIDWKKAVTQFLASTKAARNPGFLGELGSFNVERCARHVVLEAKGATRSSLDKNSYELILDVYFSQFFSAKGCFVDMRKQRFWADGEKLSWSPGVLTHVFTENFRLGMISIYEGYYFDDPKRMKCGMRTTGLIVSDNEDDVEEISELLFSHFGNAGGGLVEFDLKHFRNSFHELFLYLKKKNIQLSSDFLFLGIYLATLYTTLAKSGLEFDVKKIFTAARERNS